MTQPKESTANPSPPSGVSKTDLDALLGAMYDAGLEYAAACEKAAHDLAGPVEKHARTEARGDFAVAYRELRASLTSETATEADEIDHETRLSLSLAALYTIPVDPEFADEQQGAYGRAITAMDDVLADVKRLRAARAALGVQTAPVAWAVFNKRGEVETVRRDGVIRPAAYMDRETADVTADLLDDCRVEALFRASLPSPEQIRTTSEPTAPNLALARDAWREFASHVAGCVTCGQTSYADCFDGTQLHEAAKAADEGLLTVEPTPSFASSSPVPAEAPIEDSAREAFVAGFIANSTLADRVLFAAIMRLDANTQFNLWLAARSTPTEATHDGE